MQNLHFLLFSFNIAIINLLVSFDPTQSLVGSEIFLNANIQSLTFVLNDYRLPELPFLQNATMCK